MTELDWAITVASFLVAGGILVYASIARRQMLAGVGGLIASVDYLAREVEACGDTVRFKASYQSITDSLKGNRPLDAAWRDYSAALVELGENAPIGAAHPASSIFSSDLPYRAGIDLRRFDAVPNTLIGVGLLFTFIGLALSIFLAQSGSGNAAQTLVALSNLLEAAAFKFVTSIAAIFASLVFSFSRLKILDRLDNALAKLCEALDSMTVPASEAQLAEAARVQLEEQTGILAKRDDRLAKAIASALDTTLRENLGTALNPIAEKINAMGAQLGAQNVQALKDMVQQFSKELGGAAREHTDALVGLLDQAGRSMRRAPEAIAEASTRYAELIDQSGDNLASRIASSTGSLNAALAASEAALGGLAGRIETVGADFAAFEGGLTKRIDAFDHATTFASTSLVDAASRLEAAAKLTTPLATAAEVLGAAIVSLEVGARRLESLGTGGAAAAAALEQTTKAYQVSLDKLDQTLGLVLDRIATGVEHLDRSMAAAAAAEAKAAAEAAAEAASATANPIPEEPLQEEPEAAAEPSEAAQEPLDPHPGQDDAPTHSDDLPGEQVDKAPRPWTPSS